MAVKQEKQVKPQIRLYYQPGVEEELLDQVCAGIEEEGVPYWLESREVGDALALAYRAAQDSRLGVGIGVDNRGEGVLHFERLAAEQPLFILSPDEPDSLLLARNLGSNAARLIKGTPFKTWDERAKRANLQEENPQREPDRELIRRIVEAVLAEGAAARR